MGKVPQMIYFDDANYIEIYNFSKQMNTKNNSQAINLLIPEWKRFKAIAKSLEEQIKILQSELEVATRPRGIGVKVDKNKNK